ncbi:MAG: four helix bundle protein [Victivallales bacterium]|nr:four helix bundle protein [Victivallales bacterium]
MAEAWRKRRYKKALISKLSDSKAEAAEPQAWLEFALNAGISPRRDVDIWILGMNRLFRSWF